ncbi:MAG: hypothetical protein K5770_13735 [Lachnospiraceae bacterium]|nr:hypothetical protein [Lachnospiraceae bacterium]
MMKFLFAKKDRSKDYETNENASLFSSPPPLPVDKRERKERIFPSLSFEEAMDLIEEKCFPVDITEYGFGEDKVIILPNASNKLMSMVDWGMRTAANSCEQIYQGMGHIFVNENYRVIVISHILYIYAAERTPVSACIFKGAYDSIMERIEYERNLYAENELSCNEALNGKLFDPFVVFGPSEAVLYGHTHPGLGCYFSEPDRRSGFACESLPAVTFVLDPVNKDMRAMTGIEERDAKILVCSYKTGEDICRQKLDRILEIISRD